MKADERQPRRRKVAAADVPPEFDPRNLLQLVEGSAEAMVVVDRANGVLFANACARRVLGADSLRIGNPLPEAQRFRDAQALPVVGPDGVTRHFEVTTHEITWDGDPAQLLLLCDVTSTRTLEGHLMRVNRLYAALGQTAGAVAGATDERELFEDVCRIAVAFGGFRLAWVARAHRDGRSIERAAVAGSAAAYLNQLNLSLEPGLDGEFDPIGRALRIGVPYVCNDFAADPSTRAWQESAAKHDLASFALCPIRSGGAIAGLLCVYASEAGYFVTDLLTLLNQVAAEISVGLDRLAGRAARRRAEQALFESESRFRQMAGASRHVFWMRDVASGEVLYVSPAFELVYGRPAETALANPSLLRDMVHPEDRARAAAVLACGLRGEAACDTYRVVRHDGRICHVEEEVFPIFEAGRLVRLTGNIADISDRHAVEDQSRLFNRLVESSPEAFYAVRPDDEFRLVFLNEAGVRHFGEPLDKLLGKHVWDWNPEMSLEMCRTIWERVREEKSATFETTHRRADGSIVQVEVTATCMRHADVELCAGYFRDISARVRADTVLRESEEKFRP